MTMGDRELILGAIRRSLLKTGTSPARSAKLHIVPARGQVAEQARVDLFIQYSTNAGAAVTQLASLNEIPTAVYRLSCDLELAPTVRLDAKGSLFELPWTEAGLQPLPPPVEMTDELGVNVAYRGIAETGTLVFTPRHSGARTLSLVPKIHIAVVHRNHIVGTVEEVFEDLRKDGQPWPRAVNLITGCSGTGDIMPTVVRPAHGPVQEHVFIVGSTG